MPRPQPAGPEQAPAADRFEDAEQADGHEGEADGQVEVRHDDPGNEQHAPGDPWMLLCLKKLLMR